MFLLYGFPGMTCGQPPAHRGTVPRGELPVMHSDIGENSTQERPLTLGLIIKYGEKMCISTLNFQGW